MSAQQTLHLPAHPSNESVSCSKKQELKKDVIVWLEKSNVGWQNDSLDAGSKFVCGLTDCLWYIDGQHSTLEGRACHVPPEFKHFQGYNLPEKSRHRKRSPENLSAGVLDHHSTVLNSFLLQSWIQSGRWKAIKSAVCRLADAIAKYSSYLNEKNQEVQENHSKSTAVRVPEDAERYIVIKRARWVKPTYAAQYGPLQNHLDALKDFEPLFLNDFAPANTRYSKSTWVCSTS